MKTQRHSTRFTLLLCSIILWGPIFGTAFAQEKPRVSPKASVLQRVGFTDIKVDYSRPGVKGRKIWGGLVPYGMASGSDFTKGKPFPWRAGANENTTVSFSGDVLIEGQKLAAGTYGLHMIPSETDWVVIFSHNNSSWGSFSYKEEEDALRVSVTPVKAGFEEWLAYEFDDLTAQSATLSLHWENLRVPIKIEIPAPKEE